MRDSEKAGQSGWLRVLGILLAAATCSGISAFRLSSDPGTWIVLGNGGPYSGYVPGQPGQAAGQASGAPGQFYLTDPDFTCPPGSTGPARPGFREWLRVDHWGPDGCVDQQCQTVYYARQGSCGGPIQFTEFEPHESSPTYALVKPDGGTFEVSLNVTAFTGHVYTHADRPPFPTLRTTRKETWCTLLYDPAQKSEIPVSTYEILVETRPEDGVAGLSSSRSLHATVYFYDRSAPVAYLKMLEVDPLARVATVGGVEYRGKVATLAVSSQVLADGWLKATLELDAGGAATHLNMRCVPGETGLKLPR